MKTQANNKLILKKLALAMIVTGSAFGGTAALSQTAITGNAAGQAVSEAAVTSGENSVNAFGQAAANGSAAVETSDIAGSVKQNSKAVVQAGTEAAADIGAEAKESARANAQLVGEAAAAVQVRGDTDSVTRVTSAVNADEDSVAVDAGTLSENNLGLEVSLSGARNSAESAVENSVETGGRVKAEAAALIDATGDAGTGLVNEFNASADVSGSIDAVANLESEVSQSLAEETEAEVDGAIIETTGTLRGTLETAFEAGTNVSAEAQAAAESATEVDAGVESGDLGAEGSLVGEIAADAMAGVDTESDITAEVAGALDAAIEEAGAEATETTDIMSETASDLNSDISTGFSAAEEVEQDFSGSSALDLTGNL